MWVGVAKQRPFVRFVSQNVGKEGALYKFFCSYVIHVFLKDLIKHSKFLINKCLHKHRILPFLKKEVKSTKGGDSRKSPSC